MPTHAHWYLPNIPTQRQLEADRRWKDSWLHWNLTLFLGHLPWGFDTWFPGLTQPCYLALLRDPVDRVWSHYHFHQLNPGDTNHRFAAGKSLAQWLAAGFGRNHMTAYLGGFHSDAEWYTGQPAPPDHFDPNGEPNPEYELGQEHYDVALRHLEQMCWVGFQEQPERAWAELGRLLGVSLPPRQDNRREQYLPEGAASVGQPSTAERELIETHNHWDRLLYERARELFWPRTTESKVRRRE